MHQFLKFIFGIELYMLRTGLLFIIRSLVPYTKQQVYSGPSSYDQLDIRTTWVTTKILILTYDQSLELRPACRSGQNARL